MKNIFLILCVCLCTFCSKKDSKTPDGLYSKEQMAIIMKDLYLLESKVKDLKIDKDSAKVIYDYYEKNLFAEHEMNDSIYRLSFKYYLDDIDKLDEIYGIIADSLSLEERLEASQEETPEKEAE